MKSIVVPINFSSCSGNAARYAADLAKVIHADLHLIHVIEVPVTSAELTMTQQLYQEMLEAANTSLKELQAELTKRTKRSIKIDTRLEAGAVAAKIKDICQELKPYAVVLGSAGTTFEKFLAGSPIGALLRNLDYPVLVVPESYAFHRINRILLACDLDDIRSGLPNTLPLLKHLRDHFGSRFDIVTIETRKVLSKEQNAVDPEGWKDELKELCPKHYYLRKANVEEGILEFLSHNEADLILVFPKKHGFLDFHVSQSQKVAQHSPIPVLSLHA